MIGNIENFIYPISMGMIGESREASDRIYSRAPLPLAEFRFFQQILREGWYGAKNGRLRWNGKWEIRKAICFPANKGFAYHLTLQHAPLPWSILLSRQAGSISCRKRQASWLKEIISTHDFSSWGNGGTSLKPLPLSRPGKLMPLMLPSILSLSGSHHASKRSTIRSVQSLPNCPFGHEY